jgi:predicted NAD-dependent protein-ADP-ribosyltransferase YbiA (DUF1768 family)
MTTTEPVITIPVITIPKHTDKHLGFLNSSWVSPFEIDGKVWPSVERYVFAKQFEGTILEEKIRLAKNMYLAKLMARPKKILIDDNGHLTKIYVYGEENCQISDSYVLTKRKHFKKATKAKFHQNKKLMAMLLKTNGIKIRGENGLGDILEDLRQNSSKPKKDIKRFISNPNKDIKIDENVTREMTNSFLRGIRWVKEMENIKKSGGEAEMLEDVFYNFYDENDAETLKITNQILFVIREWVSYICGVWEEVIKNMPNFNNLVRDIENQIKNQNHKKGNYLAISIFLAAIIRWVLFDATEDERERFIFRLKIIKRKNFILPPLRRNYRTKIL